MNVERKGKWQTTGRGLAVLGLGVLLHGGRGGAQETERLSVPVITYVDQPTGIELADYVTTWPGLAGYVARIRTGGREAVKAELRRAAEGASPSDGVLNLLGQLEREDGNLDESEALVNRAISASPRQHQHYFQRALVSFAHLAKASGLGRWRWHSRTRDDYQRAFDLDSQPVAYRYYLTYTLAQSPGMAGGNKDQALRLAEGGIGLGQRVFYLVRGDVHRLREENPAAFADYDRAIANRLFRLGSFLSAGALALRSGDHVRAKAYFDWAVRCRPHEARAHEGLGDYYTAVRDTSAAAAAYREALRIDSQSSTAREKLARVRG